MSIKSDVQGFDISKNSAVVIGCGGLGTNVAVHLAGAGIGKLFVMDFDVIEERNLNRQFLYTKDDIGEEKSFILSKRLSAYAPETEVVFEDNIENGYDIIIICVDNIRTRKEANELCKQINIPCINGSINGFFGTAYMFIPERTPDLEAAGCLNETGSKNLSPSTSAAIIGALEAQLAIDYFLGKYDSAGKLYIFDNNEIHSLSIKE